MSGGTIISKICKSSISRVQSQVGVTGEIQDGDDMCVVCLKNKGSQNNERLYERMRGNDDDCCVVYSNEMIWGEKDESRWEFGRLYVVKSKNRLVCSICGVGEDCE